MGLTFSSEACNDTFFTFEVVVAKDFDNKALSILKRKKNLRVIKNNQNYDFSEIVFNSLSKNLIFQNSDNTGY